LPPSPKLENSEDLYNVKFFVMASADERHLKLGYDI
jgi:hypothetical protein